MAVRIRLARFGRSHRPFYRVVAIDSRNHREGRASEVLGTYDPLLPEKNISVDIERVHAWISQGALLTEAVRSLLKRGGYQVQPETVIASQEKKRAKKSAARKSRAKKDGKKWQAPSRRAVLKHKKAQKQERLAAYEEQLAKHRAAKEAAAAAEAPAEEEAASEG
ncbi:MAG: 30S ribosomal protein S16 [Planctomycetota bacterium]|nr:MAG: 30S ribosomal protein S16 [Planctomycetota bacterium]